MPCVKNVEHGILITRQINPSLPSKIAMIFRSSQRNRAMVVDKQAIPTTHAIDILNLAILLAPIE